MVLYMCSTLLRCREIPGSDIKVVKNIVATLCQGCDNLVISEGVFTWVKVKYDELF